MSVTHNITPACPTCDGQVKEDQKRGEIVCADCGTVVDEDTVDHGPEWRAFNHQERQEKARVGAPTTPSMHDKGLATTISWIDRDANGNLLSTRKRKQMQRLRRRHTWAQTSDPQRQNFKKAFAEINRMASVLGLPRSVHETACVIYRRAHRANLLPGRSIEAVAAAALYIAARHETIPRTFDEIAAVARVSRTRIARAQWVIAAELGLAIEPADPTAYLPRFASKLDCSKKTHRKARDLLTVVPDTYASGKNPVGLAAAALYAASQMTGGRSPSQREISDVADITCVTIRTHYRALVDQYNAQ